MAEVSFTQTLRLVNPVTAGDVSRWLTGVPAVARWTGDVDD